MRSRIERKGSNSLGVLIDKREVVMTADDRSTMDLLRGSRITAYAIGFVSLAAGIALLVWPERSTVVVARIIGILLIVVGFGQSAEAITTHRRGSYWGLLLLRGLINLGVGIALVFVPEKSTSLIVWLIGLDFLITGLLGFIVSFMVPKDMGRGGLLLQSIISVLIGVVFFWAGPDDIKNFAAVIAGIILLLLGILFLASGYQLTKARAVVISRD
ncbi:MAG: hypothetical protein RLZZ31_572 [Actinomycetota bacterium]